MKITLISKTADKERKKYSKTLRRAYWDFLYRRYKAGDQTTKSYLHKFFREQDNRVYDNLPREFTFKSCYNVTSMNYPVDCFALAVFSCSSFTFTAVITVLAATIFPVHLLLPDYMNWMIVTIVFAWFLFTQLEFLHTSITHFLMQHYAQEVESSGGTLFYFLRSLFKDVEVAYTELVDQLNQVENTTNQVIGFILGNETIAERGRQYELAEELDLAQSNYESIKYKLHSSSQKFKESVASFTEVLNCYTNMGLSSLLNNADQLKVVDMAAKVVSISPTLNEVVEVAAVWEQYQTTIELEKLAYESETTLDNNCQLILYTKQLSENLQQA